MKRNLWAVVAVALGVGVGLVPAAAGVLDGRNTSAYPALAPDVRVAGAEWVDGDAVVDGNVVSGRAWQDHPSWMRAFMSILKETAPV